jgi:hypothetical protein
LVTRRTSRISWTVWTSVAFDAETTGKRAPDADFIRDVPPIVVTSVPIVAISAPIVGTCPVIIET